MTTVAENEGNAIPPGIESVDLSGSRRAAHAACDKVPLREAGSSKGKSMAFLDGATNLAVPGRARCAILVNVVDGIAAFRHESGSQFMRRSTVNALQLIAIVGTMSEFLVASSEVSFLAYCSGMLEEITRTCVPHSAVQLAASPIDPTLLAFASLHHVIVESVSEGGSARSMRLS
jgi:hypothetical protein